MSQKQRPIIFEMSLSFDSKVTLTVDGDWPTVSQCELLSRWLDLVQLTLATISDENAATEHPERVPVPAVDRSRSSPDAPARTPDGAA